METLWKLVADITLDHYAENGHKGSEKDDTSFKRLLSLSLLLKVLFLDQ